MAVVWAAAHWTAPWSLDRNEVVDRLTVPVVAGIAAGRLAAVVLDDRALLGSLRASW